MIDDYECGKVGGMRIGREGRSTRRKPTPVPLSPPQIPHDLTRARTRAASLRSRRLTACVTARPSALIDTDDRNVIIVCQALVNKVMNCRFHKPKGIYWLVDQYYILEKAPVAWSKFPS
jgi:hypothetical protein